MKQAQKRLFLLLTVAGMLFSGCSQEAQVRSAAESSANLQSQTVQAATQPVFEQDLELQATLSIYHSWAEKDRPALDDILRGFNKHYPGVYFDVTYLPPDQLRDLYFQEAAAGRGPSILLGPVAWGVGFAEAGLIQLLDESIDASALENLNPAALEASHYQARLVSLPYALQGVVLYRNQDILTIRADNFEELVMLAQAADQGEIRGALLEQSFYFSGGHLYGLGGKLMDEKGHPAFATSAGEAWLRLLKAFEFAGETAFLSDLDLEEFKAGKVGWIIEGSWKMMELSEAIGLEKLMVDPWPEVEGGRLSGFVQSDNLFLNANVKGNTLKAARAFLEYFVNQESQAHLVEVDLIPARLYLDMPRTRLSRVIAQAMNALAGGTAYPVTASIDAYELFMDPAIQAYLKQGLPADQALTRASQAILADLEQVETTSTP